MPIDGDWWQSYGLRWDLNNRRYKSVTSALWIWMWMNRPLWFKSWIHKTPGNLVGPGPAAHRRLGPRRRSHMPPAGLGGTMALGGSGPPAASEPESVPAPGPRPRPGRHRRLQPEWRVTVTADSNLKPEHRAGPRDARPPARGRGRRPRVPVTLAAWLGLGDCSIRVIMAAAGAAQAASESEAPGPPASLQQGWWVEIGLQPRECTLHSVIQ